VLVRWRLDTADSFASKLKPILLKAASAAAVEVALVGGPADGQTSTIPR
jgi:hypothetical protein